MVLELDAKAKKKIRMAEYHRLHKNEIRKRVYVRDLILKLEVLCHYSHGTMQCKHCPESDPAFLALDHIEGGGSAHRCLTHGRSYRWARSNNYPPIFQVLCHNCNWLKYFEEIKGTSPSAVNAQKLKAEVLSAYSNGNPECAVCLIDDIRVLTIEHILGGGFQHRQRLGTGSTRLYRHLRSEGFPSGYKVLCLNHNLGAICLGPSQLPMLLAS
jgi:hypothetical protein